MEFTRIEKPPALPVRPLSGHKGLFGRVLVVGGSEEMIGAPILCGTAALRMGAGLVQVAMPREVLAAGLVITPELIGLALEKHRRGEQLMDGAGNADAIVVGPGMGTSADANARLDQLIALDVAMVVDADGLNLLAKRKKWPTAFKARAVLTPHPGEMTRLGKLIGREKTPADEEGRIKMALAAAKAFGQVVVLKGERTVVTDSAGKVYVNATGNSALSKAGSGDVLSGMVGCLLGQKMERFDAACLAVHLHGIAGEIAGERLGLRSPVARDVIEAIGGAVAKVENGGR